MKIKSSKHSIKFANSDKLKTYLEFREDYSSAVKFYVDYLFNNQITYLIKDTEITFNIKNDQLDCPTYLLTTNIEYNTELSARALKCASTQACSIVRASLEQRRKLLWIREKVKANHKITRYLTNKINNLPIVKPILGTVNPELNSICCNLERSNTSHFDYWLILSSLGKKYSKLYLPIKSTKLSTKYNSESKLLSSFMLCKNHINIRHSLITSEQKTTGKVVGVDQGLITCITMSDGQITKKDIHNHDLSSICSKLSRKKKGSKGFEKAQEHRTNYINWSINQLNFSGIRECRLEKISNIRKGKRSSRKLSAWTETKIRKKFIDRCEQLGVQVVLEGSAYMSQRCSKCGYVCKTNRKGKLFSCKRCTFRTDADLNASLNHEQGLPSIKFGLQRLDNKVGFYWRDSGLYDLNGSELTVPVANKS